MIQKENKHVFLNKLKEEPFIEIFRLQDMGDDTIFENYQRYDFYQLLWFTKVGGDDIYFLDFNEYKIEKDQIVLIFPGQIDKLDVEGKEGYLFTIHNDIFYNISLQLNSDYLNGYFSNTFISLDIDTKVRLEKINELIFLEYNSGNRLGLMKSYMEALLFHVSALFEDSHTLNNGDIFVAELMKLIDNNFICEKETDFYANSLGVTNRKINELCKKGTGKTVKQHLQEKLILEIKKEIRLRRKSLKEIAFDLGFNEPAYFTRFFKQHTNLTPTEFRDNK
ncbi:helix-turn-helix domain-containing protein [uncultured Dysgonomonas sp.]|uniref:Transcriptional regulator n=1 Tax=uncultured Dysgonomonas sp. TaxID=206096 RepID=A0A212J2G2_9BACT|nr:helix-turn-helix domain-containing protein [uncultured Dysgonomonas sp.]SBV93631.1 Transcriptional regulator [uncultured Dysgonomonas sp.]